MALLLVFTGLLHADFPICMWRGIPSTVYGVSEYDLATKLNPLNFPKSNEINRQKARDYCSGLKTVLNGKIQGDSDLKQRVDPDTLITAEEFSKNRCRICVTARGEDHWIKGFYYRANVVVPMRSAMGEYEESYNGTN